MLCGVYVWAPHRGTRYCILRCAETLHSLHRDQKQHKAKGLETFMSRDGSDLGGSILDLILELGVDLLSPKTPGEATIRAVAPVFS